MDRTLSKFLKAMYSARIVAAFVLLALVSLSFAAAGAKAGCAVPLTTVKFPPPHRLASRLSSPPSQPRRRTMIGTISIRTQSLACGT